MSSFTSPLQVEILQKEAHGRVKARLLAEFEYYEDDGTIHTVPAGYVTDFASVPRVFWAIAPPLGPYAKAAVVHDWYCEHPEILGRAKTDKMFYDGMRILNVSPRLAFSMWAAVRLAFILKRIVKCLWKS